MQSSKTFSFDVFKMHKVTLFVFPGDKSIAFFCIKPKNKSFQNLNSMLFDSLDTHSMAFKANLDRLESKISLKTIKPIATTCKTNLRAFKSFRCKFFKWPVWLMPFCNNIQMVNQINLCCNAFLCQTTLVLYTVLKQNNTQCISRYFAFCCWRSPAKFLDIFS